MRRAYALLRELEDLLKGGRVWPKDKPIPRTPPAGWTHDTVKSGPRKGQPTLRWTGEGGSAPAPAPKGKSKKAAATPVDDTKLIDHYADRLHDKRLHGDDVDDYVAAMEELAGDRRMKQPQMLALARTLGHRGTSSMSRKALLERIGQRLQFYMAAGSRSRAAAP